MGISLLSKLQRQPFITVLELCPTHIQTTVPGRPQPGAHSETVRQAGVGLWVGDRRLGLGTSR